MPSSSSIFHERSLAAAAAEPVEVPESIEIAPYRSEDSQHTHQQGKLEMSFVDFDFSISSKDVLQDFSVKVFLGQDLSRLHL